MSYLMAYVMKRPTKDHFSSLSIIIITPEIILSESKK